jgi:transcriptional regulator with XRE-family HTH domain
MTGGELRDLRLVWGMTQKDLAELLGYHVNKISEMERGGRKIPQVVALYMLTEKKLKKIHQLINTP